MRPCLHRMDDEFIPAVEREDDGFQQPPTGVEAETKLSTRLLIPQVFDP